MFKKKKINKNQNKTLLKYINYFGILLIIILSIFLYNKFQKNNDFDVYQNIGEIKENSEKVKKNNIKLKKDLEIINQKKQEEKQEKLKKVLDDKKTNILIIGRGGFGNDAPYLTDSIILLSYYKEKSQISMLSIPRDLYVDYEDKKNNRKIKGKINALYVHYLSKYKGEQNQKQKAIKKLEEKIEEITDEKIDYYIDIDFRGFIKLINSIGGVVVDVKHNLYDEKYPDKNHGFQVFSLAKGKQKLYGETALKYVRTRHNSGGDFGRSQRQQQVLKAIKQKVLSAKYLTSPSKIKNLYNIFTKYIDTDLGIFSFTKLASSIKMQDDLAFYSSTINTSCIKMNECRKGGFLYYPARRLFGGQSVLLVFGSDKNNISNYKKIKIYSKIIFNNPNFFKQNYKISIFAKNSEIFDAKQLKKELIAYGLKLNNLEKIGIIPESIKSQKNLITLEEYNRLKRRKNFNLDKYLELKKALYKSSKLQKEAENTNTKLIFNGISKNSDTIKFLKNYLQIENKDIIKNIGGPKYAKDKNTKIEIIFKK